MKTIEIRMKMIVTILFMVFMVYSLSARNWFYYRNAARVVTKYKMFYNEPPKTIPSSFSVDAPLLGNGSTGVAISGPPERQVFYLSRNDFWRLKSSYNESYPCVLGKFEFKMPAFKDASYLVEQDLFTATTKMSFSKGRYGVQILTYVSANEDLLVVEMENTGDKPIDCDMMLLNAEDEASVYESLMTKGVNKNIQWISRQFDNDVEIPSKASCAMKILKAPYEGYRNQENRFTIKVREKKYIALSFSSNFKADDCVESVIYRVSEIEETDFLNIREKHKKWWNEYWNKSFIMIDDPELEFDYYRSLYVIGSASRDPIFPPGIFGTWVTRERPEWNGDYHLNYNHQSPFYALFSSNRIEQALPYNYPIIDMIDKGRQYGKNIYGIDGVLLPVGIGPLGMDVTNEGPITKQSRQFYIDQGFIEDGGLFFFQKSNALLCVPNMSMLYYYTYDKEYAKLVYPFIKGVVDFWEGYLKYEDGRFVIHNDGVHEGPNGDFNPILSLGMLRLSLNTILDMSTDLNVNMDKHVTWKKMLDKLSDLPTYKNNGVAMFAHAEKGFHTNKNHSNLCQIIFPGGQVHLDSDKKLLQIARNTIKFDFKTEDWYSTLHTNTNYPSAVRIGLNPDSIYNDLKCFIKKYKGMNGYLAENMVGIEACSTTPSTLNEMLLRSHPNVIEVFPVWNKQKNALFQDLRAEGAFLVSSQITGDEIQYIKITSEQGKDCNIINPWDTKTISVIRNGIDIKMNVNKRFTLKTEKDDIIIIMPWDYDKRN